MIFCIGVTLLLGLVYTEYCPNAIAKTSINIAQFYDVTLARFRIKHNMNLSCLHGGMFSVFPGIRVRIHAPYCVRCIKISNNAVKIIFNEWIFMQKGSPCYWDTNRWVAHIVPIFSKNRQTSKVKDFKSQNWNISRLVFSCLCPISWSPMLSRNWRCSWSRSDRRYSNYIWVINNFIAN